MWIIPVLIVIWLAVPLIARFSNMELQEGNWKKSFIFYSVPMLANGIVAIICTFISLAIRDDDFLVLMFMIMLVVNVAMFIVGALFFANCMKKKI